MRISCQELEDWPAVCSWTLESWFIPKKQIWNLQFWTFFSVYAAVKQWTLINTLIPVQATNQTDLENWVTAIHSASASLLAKRQGKEDTLRLLRCQSRSLLHKIDMDGKMKKMAELQLSVIKEPKNRKAVQSQVSVTEDGLRRVTGSGKFEVLWVQWCEPHWKSIHSWTDLSAR